MSAATQAQARAARPAKPKAAPPRRRARKVWSGARKRVSVSALQLSLPGIVPSPL